MLRKDYRSADLPPVREAIAQGLVFVEGLQQRWKVGQQFGEVRTYDHWDEHQQYWVARVSTSDISYDTMKATVFDNHTMQEAHYIESIENFTELEQSNGWLSSLVRYKFPFPFQNRDMVIWLAQEETEFGRQFVNVTLPREYEDATNARGRYVAIEVVTELYGGVEWVMATTSDAGGCIPQFLQRGKIAAAIAADVPGLEKWLQR